MTKKDQIFEAALNLFIDLGFDNTPTSKIASEAGVATGTLFHHFKTKEDLINELYLEVKKDITLSLKEGFDPEKSIKEQIRHFWCRFIEWGMANPRSFTFNSRFCESPYISRGSRQIFTETTIELTKDIVEEGHKLGMFKNLPTDYLSAQVTGMMVRAAGYFINNPEAYANQEFRQNAFEAFWDMLAKGQ